ncbi:acetylajmalan esterase-like [Jatropha curcas]|uniref:acetylajmalan esterase-like n=1 Tax=Jatropha curcas TaxID=180498 RepID=UPI0005FBF639|nr:acetylajmalan esterase-like [Jatropha curcas]
MASVELNFAVVFFFLFHLLILPRAFNASSLKGNQSKCVFDGIYQLGDSISDTGNLIQENPSSLFAQFPYGKTYFKKPTGRCSDGLLIVDYIALSTGVPLLDAYKNPNATFTRGRGVNFAVAGSTALPVPGSITNSSLSTQLDWMFSYFNGICFDPQDCANKLKASLFIVGEIGSSDYNYALFQGKTVEEVKAMVPDVVQAISNAIKRVIEYGARRVLVPGHFPIGCLPIYLTGFKTNDTTAYDEFQCLKKFNNLSIYHNQVLQQTIEGLKKEYSNISIEYGDYYGSYQWILTHASSLGYVKSLQKACCGVGGDYNFNPQKMCGARDVTACAEPQKFISWDGINLTQEAYKHIAIKLIQDMKIKGQCSYY